MTNEKENISKTVNKESLESLLTELVSLQKEQLNLSKEIYTLVKEIHNHFFNKKERNSELVREFMFNVLANGLTEILFEDKENNSFGNGDKMNELISKLQNYL